MERDGPSRDGRFTGRCVLVTGAGSGIGAATARRLAAEGAAVAVTDLHAEKAAEVASEIRRSGGRAEHHALDVTDEEQWREVVRATGERPGPISGLVGNAAGVTVGPADRIDLPEWNRQIAVNLTAAFLGFRACLPHLRETGGAVVLVSSVHALAGLPGRPAYAAAKAGLTGLTRQLAVEYGPGVRVNAVLPGPVLTPAWDGIGEADRHASAAQTAAHRLGRPEEVASAISFLLHADASYVTGASLVVDGGWSVVKGGS
ncbi:SDR family NAD(P)-dependent oxidoreductase [Streptomyces alkaliphilus]|uniref:SDR family NAD(P)-dependent oxidoreductase n=1 Tax=Streptomyces alkaliphilus TaxID=1472722 RepID=UPI00117D5DB3|nr:SDR family oxidoreductase [Streptomyces alkaliphilus]